MLLNIDSSSEILSHIDRLTINMKALRYFETSITETASHLLEGSNGSSVCPSVKSSVEYCFYGAMVNGTGKGNYRPRRKIWVSAILSTTNPTSAVLVSDPGLRFERRKTA